MVKCNLCNQELGRITETHLLYKHRMHFSKFIKRFPEANIGTMPWKKGDTKETNLSLLRLSKTLKTKKEWNFTDWQRERKKQPIIKMLLEKKYIDKVPEIDNFNVAKLEDVALQTPDLKRLTRVSPFINLMLKCPSLEPLIRLITLLPINRFAILGRLFDGYLEMRFMGLSLMQGLRYYLRVKAGFSDYYRLR